MTIVATLVTVHPVPSSNTIPCWLLVTRSGNSSNYLGSGVFLAGAMRAAVAPQCLDPAFSTEHGLHPLSNHIHISPKTNETALGR